MPTQTRNSGLKIVRKRNQRLASSHSRTNQLLERATKLGLIDTYVDNYGRVRSKKDK
ncbi:hypothetical protein [Peribacillus simplex]|uniref:hypothetical protein n=1 Tax=Peribacillus simplex TaxID=1478 RepID=UPI001627A2FA|nr:hypothetical protein [Peribacillus simplex]